MKIEEMRRRKLELGYSYEQISELSGVPLGTVQKVLGGITKSPRHETVRALEKLLLPQGETGASGVYSCENCTADAGMIRETAVSYGTGFQKKVQDAVSRDCAGEYTVEDYYAQPAKKRMELIDGVFYDLASPSGIHQILAGEIYQALAAFIKNKKGMCVPLIAPFDVQLDCDEKTIVQPDVLVVCDRNKLSNRILYGAPDLAVEVLSKSTGFKDQLLKLNKYFRAGVREYWIVNPDTKQIMVYNFECGFECRTYPAVEPVPIGIFGGECRIDLGPAFSYVEFLRE